MFCEHPIAAFENGLPTGAKGINKVILVGEKLRCVGPDHFRRVLDISRVLWMDFADGLARNADLGAASLWKIRFAEMPVGRGYPRVSLIVK